MPRWVTFSDGYACCIEIAPDAVKDYHTFPTINDYHLAVQAEYSDIANAIADERKTGIEDGKSLPYPANPRRGVVSSCPSFCYTPTTCQGRSACPRNYACSE